ncbi:PepSY domain-containing protein [Methylotenera sp. N17]|uniref:PepSY domain-containing protein n=1 Tax=Methylotenera sp. N17 TaxID=1502761 RepID=UPI000645C068|nr:PepSY domain-containing protein [Methylotenera sp. N17]
MNTDNYYFNKCVSACANALSVRVLLVIAPLAIALVWFTGQPISAGESPATARKLSASGQILSLEKITKAAKALKPGEILETELERKHGAYVYEVEILDDKGLVWELKLDAKTGKLIKMEQDD